MFSGSGIKKGILTKTHPATRIREMKTLYILRILLLVLFASFLLSIPLTLRAEAYDPQIKFHRLTIDQGLAQSTVNCILHDSKGFMWFGTQGGLNRYDGYRFQVYTYDPDDRNSVSSSFIFSLLEDKSGVFWIGTKRGLNRFDPSTEKFTRYLPRPESANSLSHSVVKALHQDKDGFIWIGTEGGLNRFDPVKEEFSHYLHRPEDPAGLSHDVVSAILEDSMGNLWIGTMGGLDYFHRKSERFRHYRALPGSDQGLSDNRVFSLFSDKPGELWIGTGNGVNRFLIQHGIFTHYLPDSADPNSLSNRQVNCFSRDKDGAIWVGTENGLNHMDCETGRFTRFVNDPHAPDSLSENHVYSMLKDRAGNLWIGTRIGGLSWFSEVTNQFASFRHQPDNPDSLSDNSVNYIYEDRAGFLWLGTLAGGLSRLDEKNGKFIHFKHDPENPESLSHNEIHSIFEDYRGRLWIGTRGGGLERMETQGGHFTRFIHHRHSPTDPDSLSSDDINVVHEDKKRRLWIGTLNGLNRYDRKNNRFIHYRHDPANPESISDNSLRAIVESPSGILWIGTENGGLNRFDPETGIFNHYQHHAGIHNSLSHNYILSLHMCRSGYIWIGTIGGGLNRFDPDAGRFIHFTTNDGLPDNVVYQILEDEKGNLWLSTNRGLSMFNPHTRKFKNYDRKYGLSSDEFNFGAGCRRRNGKMYFGGIKGLNAFFPDSIRQNTYRPPVVLTDLQISNQSIPIGKMEDGRTILEKAISFTNQITLSHKDSVVSLEFTALNYFYPEKNQYAYKMEGFESEWNHVGTRRFASYINLPPGRYTFRVKGSNNEGVWNERGYSLRIIITPPFWKSWWFWVIVALLAVSSALFLHQLRVSSVENHKKELEVEVSKRTKQLEKINYIIKSINREIDFTELLKSLKHEAFIFKGIEKASVLVYDIFKHVYRFKAAVDWNIDVRGNTGMTYREVNSKLLNASREVFKDIFIVKKPSPDLFESPPTSSVQPGVQKEEQTEAQKEAQKEAQTGEQSGAPLREAVPRAMLIIRIRGKKHVAGYLIFANMQEDTIFDHQDLQLLKNLKDHIVSAFLKSKLLLELKYTNDYLEEARAIAERERQTAESANESKSQFLARMSHEIRTPLNGVIGFIDMLLDSDLNEEQKEYAVCINQSGQTLLTLVDDILDFSRIEAGLLSFESVAFDPVLAVYSVCDLVRSRIGEKPLEIICRIGDNIPAYVNSDPGRFRQVLINLMGNAVKFTEEGEIEISLELVKEEESRLQLHIRVRDTGIGIPEDKLESVFEVFQQADGSITRKYGGSGLGLTICRQISNIMGGDVFVESQPGEGTTFHFTSWVEKSSKPFPTRPIPVNLAGKRALIVDDNVNSLEIIANQLTSAHLEVSPFADGESALAAIREAAASEKPFDFCLTDIRMPGMDGYQLTREIRSLSPSVEKLIIVALFSAAANRPKSLQELGFNGHFAKPIHRQRLLELLSRLAVRQQRKAQDTASPLQSGKDEPHPASYILLVEDNPMNQKLMRHMLTRAGYQMDLAVNGQDGVEMFSSEPEKYDLILMDIQMPVTDGKEATRIIRGLGFKDIPIIAMTAQTMKGDREKCLAAGMDDYISKPIKKEEVLKTVRKWTHYETVGN